jgi:hypothetical protein
VVHKDAFVEPFRLFRTDDPVVQRLALASLRPVGQRAQVTRRRGSSQETPRHRPLHSLCPELRTAPQRRTMDDHDDHDDHDDDVQKAKMKWWERSALWAGTSTTTRATCSSPSSLDVHEIATGDLGETKVAWWERSVVARTSNNNDCAHESSAASVADEHDEKGKPVPGRAVSQKRPNVAAAAGQARPGAVAVRGPGFRGDDDEVDDISTVRGGGTGDGANGDDEMPDAPLQVDSYAVMAVQKGPTDEEIRQQILAGTPRAQPVCTVGNEPKVRWDRSTMLLLAFILAVGVVVAIAVGVAVPLATRPRPPDDDYVAPEYEASVAYREWPSVSWAGFALWIDAATFTAKITLGNVDTIQCRPKACLQSNESCVVGAFYSPGCCAGPDCPGETKCGAQCSPTQACNLKDPINRNCYQSECYSCDQKDGKDLYSLRDFFFDIDCLKVGTAVRPENEQLYKWAIFCGPAYKGFTDDDTRYHGDGEYHCGAVRLGANFSDDRGGLVATFPCPFLARAECGCGPSGSNLSASPAPNGPCLPEGGCPFLCSAGYARKLCRSFPGNISWWEGQNSFHRSWFLEDRMAREYDFDIYIKGENM